jgi:hypothetical protein
LGDFCSLAICWGSICSFSQLVPWLKKALTSSSSSCSVLYYPGGPIGSPIVAGQDALTMVHCPLSVLSLFGRFQHTNDFGQKRVKVFLLEKGFALFLSFVCQGILPFYI